LYLAIASLALVLAVGGLPTLDARYASFPILLTILAIAALRVYPYLQPPWLENPPARPNVSALIGEEQFLLLDLQVEREGNTTTVEAVWQVVGEPAHDYTAFVHLLDEEGELVGQADAQLADEENIPSSGWPVGYLVQQRYQTDTDPAPTQVRLGLYDLETLERLPVMGGGDSITIPVVR
ncbi:MAG: hypothetical protein M3220_14710, partial [Chloroflexota bacterium]|nr:hypothetical protein [Chloroflexota bacterium]